jgi:hypothetical protein
MQKTAKDNHNPEGAQQQRLIKRMAAALINPHSHKGSTGLWLREW